MESEDLTPDEREALDRLRANAPEAPEALASLDDAGRARVLEALTHTGIDIAESGDAVADATGELSSDAADDEPTPESAPASQSTGPSTLVDRLLARNVDVAGKKVPLVPSSVAVLLVVVALILIVRACGGDNPLQSLAEAGTEAVDSLDDAAEEVGDDRLFNAADRVRDDMRTLLREADADFDDFDEALDAGEAVADLGAEILGFVSAAASSAESAFDEETAIAAADAARVAARIVTNDKALDQAEALAERVLDTHIKENARRADSDEVDEFRRAARDVIDAARQKLITSVDVHLARAELVVARIEEPGVDDARDALDEAIDRAETAYDDYGQAVDDFCFFEKRVEWRGGFPSCDWESRPF